MDKTVRLLSPREVVVVDEEQGHWKRERYGSKRCSPAFRRAQSFLFTEVPTRFWARTGTPKPGFCLRRP